MKLIGLVGKKQSGKDTVAQLFEEAVKPKIVGRVGFADALKDELAMAISLLDYEEKIEGEYVISKGKTYTECRQDIDNNKYNFRLIMQGWGTDFRRKLCGENYWVDKVLFNIEQGAYDKYDYLIITDCRFQNEADMIKKRGGIMARIVRDNLRQPVNHISETEQNTIACDFTVYNNQTIEDLKVEVKSLIQYIQ